LDIEPKILLTEKIVLASILVERSTNLHENTQMSFDFGAPRCFYGIWRPVQPSPKWIAALHRRFVDGPLDVKKVSSESPESKKRKDTKMNLHTLNIWAIAAAALSAFLIGGLWYSPMLLGSAWKKANGFAGDGPSAGAKGFAIAFILSLVMAANLAMFLNAPGTTLAWGATAGFLAGAGWGAAGIGIVAVFEGRSLGYVLINGGYLTVALTVMGAILGGWR
jgi:hypothetical protein